MVLPGGEGRCNKPESRTLVLGGLGAPPTPRAVCWKPQRSSKRPGKRLGQQSPLRPMTARPRLRQLEGGGDQFLLTDDHVARLVFSASEVCGGPTVHQVRPRQMMTCPRWHNTESVGWDQHPGTRHLEASCSPMLPQGTSRGVRAAPLRTVQFCSLGHPAQGPAFWLMPSVSILTPCLL